MSTMQKATTLLGWSLIISAFVLWVDIGSPLFPVLLDNAFGAGFAVLYWAFSIYWAWCGLKKIVSFFWKGPPPPPPAVEVFEPLRGNYREQARTRSSNEALLSLAEDVRKLRELAEEVRQHMLISDAQACCGSPSSRAPSSCVCGASR
jgi:hypothetical protein